MSIKSQGGVFGRNPTFNEVDIDGQLSVDNGTLHVDPINNRVGINTTSPDEDLQIVSATPRIKFVDTGASAGVYNLIDCNGASGRLMLKVDDGDGVSNSYIGFHVDGSEVGRWNSDGNLVIANAGNGIDFSATAGTGTSELFNDYEEGTFTVAASRITDLSTTVGRYTKIGNLVTCEITIEWTATDGTGNSVLFTGLPFTSAAGAETPVGAVMVHGTDINTDVGSAIVLRVDDNQTRFLLSKAMDSAAATVTSSSMNSATLLRSTFTYRAA